MAKTVELRALAKTIVNNVFNVAVPVEAGQIFWTRSAYGSVLIQDGIAEPVHRIEPENAVPEADDPDLPEDQEEPVEEETMSFEEWLQDVVGLSNSVVRSIQIAGIEDYDLLADRLETDLPSVLAIKGVGVKTVKALASELGKLNAPEESEEKSDVEES
jgi:hypothetical protein